MSSAVTPDGRIVLVRQFRFGIDDFSLEIPGGVVEPGEDPVAAGTRELREETGFGGPRARLLASVHPNPAIQRNRCHLVLVEGVECGESLDWDEDEEISVADGAGGRGAGLGPDRADYAQPGHSAACSISRDGGGRGI